MSMSAKCHELTLMRHGIQVRCPGLVEQSIVGETFVANRDVVAIGTSAGGVEALIYLAKQFPASFPAAVLITVHLPSDFSSGLDEILGSAGALPVSFAEDSEPLEEAHIYLAPPKRHLLAEGQNLALGTGPRENWARPAIDPMMRSVAVCCGTRAIGVILTGALGDGASGLQAIRQCGGIAVVQDPSDAAFSEMPSSALNLTAPQHVDVGHALSAEAMSVGITDKVREALYVALRALDEQAALTNKLLTEAAAKGRNLSTDFWMRKKEEADRQRNVLQSAINHTDEIAFQSPNETGKGQANPAQRSTRAKTTPE